MPDSTLIGHGFFYDQMPVGFRFHTLGRTVTEADLVSFVNLFWIHEDNFVNVEGHPSRAISGRFVPGAMVYCMAEGLLLPTMQLTGLAFLGTRLDHKAPVRVGDTIRVEAEVIESRKASKGNRGLVRTRTEVKNQRNEVVLIYEPLRLMRGSEEKGG